jgi:hypothetical protein
MEKRHPAKRQERLARAIDFDDEERRQLRADAATDPSVLFARGVALNRAARLFHEAGQKARER